MKHSQDVELCSQLFITWLMHEQNNKDMKIRDKELGSTFIFQVIHKKFDVFGIEIVLPDELLAIITTCTNSNPGQSQVLLKYLLEDIKKRKGPIPKGYVITADDFSFAFQTRFPILHEYKDLNEKFQKMWNAQKKEKTNPFDSDNKCDTPQ